MYWRNYPDFSFILVYLEDYVKKADNSYALLIDFFTVYDYLRFEEFFHGEQAENDEKEPPHSSFIKVDNYISQDAPIKDTHYLLDLNMLKGRKHPIKDDYLGCWGVATFASNTKSHDDKGRGRPGDCLLRREPDQLQTASVGTWD